MNNMNNMSSILESLVNKEVNESSRFDSVFADIYRGTFTTKDIDFKGKKELQGTVIDTISSDVEFNNFVKYMYMDKEGFTSKITNMYIECKSSSEFTFNIMFDTNDDVDSFVSALSNTKGFANQYMDDSVAFVKKRVKVGADRVSVVFKLK
nr:MAG TPA: hypothetical protein [Caudoviricetes sp.]